MTSVSGGSELQFQSLDPRPNYTSAKSLGPYSVSDGTSGTILHKYDSENPEDEGEIDDISIDEETFEYLNEYFRAGHDGCEEYTNMTTFHGMVRVFKSQNCPSLIFWCLVVTTCLVFYMMVCGTIIKSYSQQSSFMRVNETINLKFMNDIDLCSKYSPISCTDFNVDGKLTCSEIEAHCITIRFSTKVKIRLKKELDVYFRHGTEKDEYFLLTRPHIHHHVGLKVFQIERLDLTRAPCHQSWNDVKWINEDATGQEVNYTLTNCEKLRFQLKGDIKNLQEEYPCQPSCFETRYEVTTSDSWQNSEHMVITFNVFETVTHMQETRKTTLIDILCYLGGASSLFMGCSCVTLMEMFVFLVKLVSNSVCSNEVPEPDDTYYNEKYAFEYSDNRNKRRYAICDRETMEKYLLAQQSVEVRSINLDRRVSIFSFGAIQKAPKLRNLRNNRNFDNLDIYDTGTSTEPISEEPLMSTKDEYSVDYQDEKLDTLGDVYHPAETRKPRPPLRRASTAHSHVSHQSNGSSLLTTRSFAPMNQRRMSKAFTRNMPMNDF